MKKKVLSVIVLVIVMFSITVNPVMAIDEPDSVALSDIVVFEDLLATDDFLAFVPYNITFGTQPDENIDETFIFRMLSVDNATEIGVTLAKPAYNGGYGPGVVSFYISTNITWGAAYIFRVQQNPAHYPAALYWDFAIGEANYSVDSDQAAALKVKVIDSATFLQTSFGVDLLAKSESGSTVLSGQGELYYLDAIPGLQNMNPLLFSVQLENPDYTKRTWSVTFADALKTKYAGTFIEDFMTGFAGIFSLETSPAMNFLCVILYVLLIGFSVWKFKATMISASLDGFALLLLLMLMGFFSMIWAGFIAFCSVVLGGVILLLNKG